MDKDLERSEWDFSSCRKRELNNCLNWEYLRQIIRSDPEIAQRIVHPFLPLELHRPGATASLIEWQDDPEMETRRANFQTQKDLAKYFPERPYLRLPPDYRSRLLAIKPSKIGYRLPERILEIKPRELVPHIWSDDSPGRFEVLSLGIDWSLADDAIIDSFRKIIRARRGKRKPDYRRGTAPHKLMRDRLKRLGALRVWRHWAANFSEIQHGNARGLYRTRQAWIKQTGLAADDVRHFREQLENQF
jgi:hypothetical protein